MSSTTTQAMQILAYLKTGRSLTQLDAYDRFDCTRLGARIFDLKQDGHNITSERVQVPSGKRVASYTLVQ